MKFQGLLVAVVVLAVLAGTLYWSNKKKAAEAAKPSTDTTPKLVSIPEDQFKEIRLKKANEITVLRKGDDGKWQIVEPKPLRADQDSVGSLVSTLSSLNGDAVVEEKASDLAPFGLQSPSLDVTVVRKDGKMQDVLVGEDTPAGSDAYAKLPNDPRVFTIASYIKSNLNKTSNDLRDKRLLTFDSEKLTRVDLQAKGQSIEFGKNAQNDWQILKPRPLRADGSLVEDLIRKLKDAKLDTSVSEADAKKAAAAYAAGTKVAIASVSDASGTQQLDLRKDKDKNYYAKSSVVEGVYKVTSDLGDGLDKTLNDFRNKKLFDFGWNDPTKLEIHNGAQAATYQKSGEKWMSGQKQMDGPSVTALVDKLRDLTSIKFPDSGGGGSPVFEATVTSNDGKRVEKVSITKQGNSYFAKRENELTIYELDGKAVEELQKAAGEVKEFQAPKKPVKK